jgi:predicted DNA-binding protein (UPF0251 family)
MRRKVMLVGVAALAAAGGGAAIAAATGSPNDERKAVIDDAAKQLGVTPAKLSSALKKALENRVDAAVAAGRLTTDQGEALKKRIESDDYPALGLGFGLGHRGGPGGPGMHRGGHLDAAAAYLGVSQDALRAQLEDGKTLADVAKATKSKSVDGLVAALVADEKEKLDAAVKAGRLTQAQADMILADAKARTTDLVNGTFSARPHGRFGGPGDGNGPLRTAPRRHRTTI